jgi:hypothetical protein
MSEYFPIPMLAASLPASAGGRVAISTPENYIADFRDEAVNGL